MSNNLTSLGLAEKRMLSNIVLSPTLFPAPVAPATSRCGMVLRSAVTGAPKMSFPSANVSFERALEKAPLINTSLMETVSRETFGTSMPTTDFPGSGATMRRLTALSASARSSARFTIRATLVPGAGSNSYIVTTGPGRTSVTRPSMPKLAKAFESTSV